VSFNRISNIYYINIRANLTIDTSVYIFFCEIDIVNFPFSLSQYFINIQQLGIFSQIYAYIVLKLSDWLYPLTDRDSFPFPDKSKLYSIQSRYCLKNIKNEWKIFLT